MAEEAKQEPQEGGGEFLDTVLGLALLVATPIALGWLSERMERSQKEAGAGRRVRHGQPLKKDTDALPATVSPLLYERATRDITAQDRRGELPEILWRGREIDQLATLMGGPHPESVLLVGESGIGKTALVEGLVQGIHAGQAPDLRNYAVLEFRADCLHEALGPEQAEEQAEAFLAALSDASGDVIAFFDDFQHFAKMGKQFSFDQRLLYRLQQALVDRRIRCIAAIDTDEYRRSMDKDSIWQRCFTELRLEKRTAPEASFGELNADKTYAILQQRTADYPTLYELEVKPQAIEEAIRLAERYLPVEQLPTQRLPGKALRLLEETAKRMRPRWDVSPGELTTVQEEIAALELKQARTRSESPHAPEVESRLRALRQRRATLEQAWEALKAIRQELGRQVLKAGWLHRAIESAILNDADALATRYREELEALQEQRRESEKRLAPLLAEFSGLKDYLTAADVDRLFSELTGIPVTEVSRDEQELLLHLERWLHQRVVGQEEAIEAVARALRRARAGVRDEGRPIGNFVFLGPSGVGKTELAKALAETLFGDEAAMQRLDMGEYYGPHCVARLVGAPPGYVGYEGGGQLTEAVRRRPNSVVLFDEIEKADPKIFDALLQVLDDGHLTDGQGRTVDFKHTLIIMTSNVGSQLILQRGAEGAREEVLQELQTNSGFRPEFLNRMDAIIFFEALNQQDLRAITEMEFAKLQARLRERNGIDLRLSEAATTLVIERGYNPVSGAREIKRTMQDLIADKLAPIILARRAVPGDTLWIERVGEDIEIHQRSGAPVQRG